MLARNAYSQDAKKKIEVGRRVSADGIKWEKIF